VKMIREIRDRLSKEFMNMSYEEQKRYIRKELNLKHGECALSITEHIWLR